MRYFLSSRALLSLLPIFLILACTSHAELTPEESLQSYINLLSEGRVGKASEFRYSPLREWANLKEVLGAVVVLSLISVVVRFTGLNPFSTMLNCWLIENYVSPENRKYVFIAIGAVFLITAVGFYNFLTGFLSRIVIEGDMLLLEELSKVEILESRVSGERAYVYYLLIYSDGEEVEREAELWYQDGMWRVRKL